MRQQQGKMEAEGAVGRLSLVTQPVQGQWAPSLVQEGSTGCGAASYVPQLLKLLELMCSRACALQGEKPLQQAPTQQQGAAPPAVTWEIPHAEETRVQPRINKYSFFFNEGYSKRWGCLFHLFYDKYFGIVPPPKLVAAIVVLAGLLDSLLRVWEYRTAGSSL